MKGHEAAGIPHEFVNAKVRGMRSRLFEGDRLRSLLDLRSLPELCRRILPGGVYSDPIEFERGLLGEHVRQLDRVSRYLSGPAFELFQWLMVRFLLENVKTAARCLLAGTDPGLLLAPLPSWLGPQPADPSRFVESIPVEEIRTELAGLLSSEKTPDPFTVDMVLDRAYFRKLAALGPPLGGWIRRLTACDLDSRNLLLLLRARFAHRMELAAVAPFLAPSGVRLSGELARRLFSAPDLSAALDLVPPSLLAKDVRREVASLGELEDALLSLLYRLAARCFAESMLDVAVVFGFYYIKRIEFSNLIRVAEGIRHALPGEEIESKLVLLDR